MTFLLITTIRPQFYCFILIFNFTGYGYPYSPDSHNIGDDGEDEVLTSPTFDLDNWQASSNQPTGPVHTTYNNPVVAEQPAWVPPQNLPDTPSGPEVERLINGASRNWGLENLDEPLVFPLWSEPAMSQPGPVQPQSTQPNVASPDGMYAFPHAGGSTHSASATAYHAPSATSQAANPPISAYWQPEPVSSGYGVADFNTGSSAAGGNIRHLVYEDVFQYLPGNEPSQSYGYEEPSSHSYPTNVGAQPILPSGTGSFPGRVNLNFRQTDYQPHSATSWHPQNPVNLNTQKVEVSQRVSEPVLPLPSSYIVQSRNSYQRDRYSSTHLKYSPEAQPPMPISSKGVKGPAPSQPAASKGAKNPQWYVYYKPQSLNA